MTLDQGRSSDRARAGHAEEGTMPSEIPDGRCSMYTALVLQKKERRKTGQTSDIPTAPEALKVLIWHSSSIPQNDFMTIFDRLL